VPFQHLRLATYSSRPCSCRFWSACHLKVGAQIRPGPIIGRWCHGGRDRSLERHVRCQWWHRSDQSRDILRSQPEVSRAACYPRLRARARSKPNDTIPHVRSEEKERLSTAFQMIECGGVYGSSFSLRSLVIGWRCGFAVYANWAVPPLVICLARETPAQNRGQNIPVWPPAVWAYFVVTITGALPVKVAEDASVAAMQHILAFRLPPPFA